MARTQFSTAVARDGLALARARRFRLDPATIVGLLSGVALLLAATALGGSMAAFLDLPSFLIVVGGTLAVTVMSYSLDEVLRAHRISFNALLFPGVTPRQAVRVMLRVADIARKKGLLAIEQSIEELTDDPMAERAIRMVIDGSSGEEIERVLTEEVRAMNDRHADCAGVFRKASEVSPAMGLIGTLVGLVQMLGNLHDPATIGPSMAIALLTTFYGAVLSTMVFAPIAAKLERNAATESLVAHVYLLGTASIGRKENPRRLEILLNALLPPARRIQYFD